VLAALRAFFDETKGVLQHVGTYIIDYAVEWGDGEVKKVWIVEVNNPPPVAGTSMFSKKNPQDLDIMWGRAPFEFRIVEDLPEDPMQSHRLWLEMAQRKDREKERARAGGAFAAAEQPLRTSL
jgi:hypothetical protein